VHRRGWLYFVAMRGSFSVRQSTLCLPGAEKVERGQLALIPTPDATETWCPIPHTSLLDQVMSTLDRSGLRIVTEAHGVTPDGANYFGLLHIAATNGDNAEDFGLVVGVRNSHSMRFPAGLVVGAQVTVCSNLSFSGEIKIARKHTRFIMRDLPMLVERAIGQLGDQRRTQEKRFLTYKQHELGDQKAHDLIVRSLDAQVLPVTKIPDVIKEWREPRHADFNERTAWSLFNGFTEVLKYGNIDMLPKRTQALHGLMDTACGLIVPNAEPQFAIAT
jgi:hypothetical protein